MKKLSSKPLTTIEDFESLRGIIISRAITIEGLLEVIIVNYFLESNAQKKAEFHDSIGKDLMFGKKKEIFKRISNSLAYKISDSNHSLLLNHLDTINTTRNLMAHSKWSLIMNESVTIIDNKKKSNKVIDRKTILEFETAYTSALGLLTRIFLENFDDEVRALKAATNNA